MNNIPHTTTLSVGKPTTHHPHGDDDVRVVAVEEEGHSSCLLLGHVKPVGTTNTESSCHKRCPSAAASSLAGPAAMERVLRDIPRESHRGLPLTLALTEVGEALRAKRDKSRRRHDEWTSKACEATRNAMSRIESARLESDASTLRHDRLLREKYADDQVERFQRASERDDRLRRAQLKRADIVHRGEVNHLHEHRHEDEEEKEEEQKNTKKKMKARTSSSGCLCIRR